VKEVSNSWVIGTWPNNGISFLSKLSVDSVLWLVHVKARKRETERERERGWKEKEPRPTIYYYALASKSGAIEQGGVKREDRPRQQLSLEAFFYVSFDPDLSLFSLMLFILILLLFHSFSLYAYVHFFFCYFISCGESFAYHLAQVPTDSLLFDLLFVLILRSAASRLSSQRQHFENEASGNRVLQNNRAGFAFR
jgi:hypothetical protein